MTLPEWGRKVLLLAIIPAPHVTDEMKWNEPGFRPPLCTYRLNWARRTSWGWWDDWDDTVLQTQDSKFEPWRSEAEHATSRSQRLPTILTFTRGWGRNNFCFFQTAETGNRTPYSGVKGSGANHYPRAPAPCDRWPTCSNNFDIYKIFQRQQPFMHSFLHVSFASVMPTFPELLLQCPPLQNCYRNAHLSRIATVMPTSPELLPQCLPL